MNSFSTRWNGHRPYWNRFEYSENSDKSALLTHFAKHHPVVLNSNPTLPNCFEVIFIEQPKDTSSLDWLEDKWFHKLNASININKLLLPKFK